MKGNRWLTFAVYVLAGYLVFVPLYETSLAVFPPALGDASWRFGAMGLFSQALMTPLLGVIITLGISLELGHRRSLLVLSVVCTLAAVVLLVSVPLFVMDASTIRGAVEVQGRESMMLLSGASLVKMVLAFAVAVAVALGGWSATREPGAD